MGKTNKTYEVYTLRYVRALNNYINIRLRFGAESGLRLCKDTTNPSLRQKTATKKQRQFVTKQPQLFQIPSTSGGTQRLLLT